MILKLIEKRKETEEVNTFIFKPDYPINWIAGQYLIYSLDHDSQDKKGKMRFFTISSPPFLKNPSITTKINNINSSSFKKKLNMLEIGQTINAKGPDGDFVIKDENKDYIFIAGGIGITPFYSIIKQLNFENKKINVTLIYSNKNDQILFKKDFDEISKNNEEFKLVYVIHPQRIDLDLLSKFAKKDDLIFVSGPDPMVEAIVKMLDELNVPKENIKEDYFSGYLS